MSRMARRDFTRLAGAGLALAAAPTLTAPAYAAGGKKRVFVLTRAQGFAHSSRPVAAKTVAELGAETGDWEVVGVADSAAEVAAAITAAKLAQLDLVFFANTTGNLEFTPEGRAAFYAWIRAGGAYAGVHSAGDTFHGDADYLDLVRGEFQTHGPQRTVEITVQDPKHPATAHLDRTWTIHDEIYEYKNWARERVHVLLSMNRHPQRAEYGDFPVAWTHRPGKGRMFYTSLGHREDVYANPLYRQHLIGGMRWALGLAKGDDTPGNRQI